MTTPTDLDRRIHVLHRYFIWANRMRQHCIDVRDDQGERPEGGMELRWWLSAPLAYSCYWFATLYVVVEGFGELKLADSEVERLLSSTTNVDRLRRFRNGVYHFQPDYFDARLTDFLKAEYMEWAIQLHNALSQFFLRFFDSRGYKHSIVELPDGSFEITFQTPAGESNAE